MKNNRIEANSETLEIPMDSLVSAGQVFQAIQFLKGLEEVGAKCDLESLYILSKSLALVSCQGCRLLFNTIKGITHSTCQIMQSLIELIRRRVIGAAMMTDWLSPDPFTSSHCIEALGNAGWIDDSVNVSQKIEEKGWIPDTMNYNTLVSDSISAGDLEKCFEYYKDMSRRTVC